jgi:hypothetical protein
MNTYTQEEYWELYYIVDPALYSFCELLQRAAEGKCIVSYDPSRASGKMKLYNNFSDCVQERFGFVYPIMYTIPTEELPLYINETSNMLFKTIVRWRLSIGK